VPVAAGREAHDVPVDDTTTCQGTTERRAITGRENVHSRTSTENEHSNGGTAARSARAPDQLSLVDVTPETARPTGAALVRVEGEVIPAPSWSSRAIKAWQKSRGIASKELRGRICARLSEIVKLIGDDATVDAWTRYLHETTDKPQFITPETFARTYRSWLPGGRGDTREKPSPSTDALRRAMEEEGK
jgi:hypothetical protein